MAGPISPLREPSPLSSIGAVVSEEKMFENVDGWTTDAGVTGILIAHLGAFGSGELKIEH